MDNVDHCHISFWRPGTSDSLADKDPMPVDGDTSSMSSWWSRTQKMTVWWAVKVGMDIEMSFETTIKRQTNGD